MGPPLRAAAGTPPPSPPLKNKKIKNGNGKRFWVWILAARRVWPSAKKNKNGNGFGPGSGQESVQKTLATPASAACGPDWPNRPSPKEISLCKRKNRSRFFLCPVWRPETAPAGGQNRSLFFYFSRKPARAGHGPARAKPQTVPVF